VGLLAGGVGKDADARAGEDGFGDGAAPADDGPGLPQFFEKFDGNAACLGG
jgi:hypothetical protein